jgi:carbon-monoxide dehydrogenase small subunit
MSGCRVSIEINGLAYERSVEPRLLLSDFIRHEARLTGTRVGCEHGICGTCTVQLDGDPIRSCLLFSVQANGRRVRTVEALCDANGELHPLQQAFRDAQALQCGYCTPGFLMTIEPLLRTADATSLDETTIREALAGNLCRCTGYQNIVDAVRRAAERCAQ